MTSCLMIHLHKFFLSYRKFPTYRYDESGREENVCRGTLQSTERRQKEQ